MLGIRGSVWTIAALVVGAAWSLQLLDWRSGRNVVANTELARARTPDTRASSAANRVFSSSGGGARQSALHAAPRDAAMDTAAPARPDAAAAETIRPASPRTRVDADPELIRDLRILEEEAARVANGARWLARAATTGSAGDAAAPAPSPPPGLEDPQRRRLSDAALEEYLVRRSYAGIVFPAGYPAERVARLQARRQIETLSPAARRALLTEAVEALRGPEEGPEFHAPETGRVWAGGPG